MFRILLTVIVGAVVGGALGGLQYAANAGRYLETFEGTLITTAESTGQFDATQKPKGTPKVEVLGGATYEFGTMMHGESMSHEFVVRNVGTGELVLEKAGSTCKCTVGEMQGNVLQPNEQTIVTLSWTAETIMPMFGQSATFKTNDPEMAELKFTVEGQVASSFVIEPSSLSVGDLSVNDSAERTFYVYTYLKDSNELNQFSWSKPETRHLIDFHVEQVPVEDTPYERHKNALLAHKVTIKFAPGLPLGPLSGRIQFQTDLEEKVGMLELAVSGRVDSDMSLVGGSLFDMQMNLLSLGSVKSSEGVTVGLTLIVQGDSRETIEPVIESWEPKDAMRVTIGEPKVDANRKRYQIQIEVPKGAPEVYYPGTGPGTYGKIVIKTNHETMKELPIYVRLVVVK